MGVEVCNLVRSPEKSEKHRYNAPEKVSISSLSPFNEAYITPMS